MVPDNKSSMVSDSANKFKSVTDCHLELCFLVACKSSLQLKETYYNLGFSFSVL